jgi:beta-aspartyl-peptidase (threonine type)
MVPALIAHGGAGGDPDDKPTYREAMGDALRRGWAILRLGGSALLAVEATIQAMEDHPRFNAGHGSALTEQGTVECDASIMEGDTLQAGAVGAVSGVRSAIGLARRILEDGRHILLVGEGALAFAREQGLPGVSRDRPGARSCRGGGSGSGDPGTVGHRGRGGVGVRA